MSPLQLLHWTGRNGTKILAIGVLVGFAIPPLAQLARPMLVPMLLLPLIIALMRLDWQIMGSYVGRPVMIGLITFWALIVSPVAAYLVTEALGIGGGLQTALVLMTAAPPIVSAAAIALFVGLNGELVVVAVIVCMVLAPFTLPLIALALLGLELQISLLEFMLRLGGLIGSAFIVAAIARKIAGPAWLRRQAPSLDAGAVLAMLVFALAIMDGVTEFTFQRPIYVVACIVAAFLANLVLQGVSSLLFLKFGGRDAMTIGLLSGNCNMGLVLAVLADKASFEVIVFFAMGQLPMYMLPAVLSPIYRRFSGRPPAPPAKPPQV
ncbi:hypothetical protein [Oceanibacterium hippocampi]|uniref:Sodium Bile acid symporter family protein n=1 Tax=Oceanibacterium hippocampi TaxID=745714 RepID=A0A1Y5SBP3_9PROT|nr:hypothetical protein [Oceanibacterium hippocampi]SLN37093.1 hypothetical protein OCH7691_01506 [Oceanibacterium hippocampi]